MPTTPVTVRVFASFRQFTNEDECAMAIEDGQTVGDLVDQLRIPVDQVRLVFVDHRIATLQTQLHGGERVGLFPAVGGG